MKGFLEEYGKIILVVCVILLMLTFSKAGLVNQIGDSINSVITDLYQTSQSYLYAGKSNQLIDINSVIDGVRNYHNRKDVFTFDIYINDKQEGNDIGDFYKAFEQGSKIVINDIKVNPNYKLIGYSIGDEGNMIQLESNPEIITSSKTNNRWTRIYLHFESIQ